MPLPPIGCRREPQSVSNPHVLISLEKMPVFLGTISRKTKPTRMTRLLLLLLPMSFSHYLWSTLMSMPTTAHHENPSSSSRISKLVVRRRSPIPNAAGKMLSWSPTALLLLSFCCFCILVTSPCIASPAEMAVAEDQPLGADEADFDLEAKRCQAAYECWPTEPVLADGRPLFMASIMKRLNIGSGFQTRGAKCRCREGQCTFYSVPKRRFFNCQEL